MGKGGWGGIESGMREAAGRLRGGIKASADFRNPNSFSLKIKTKKFLFWRLFRNRTSETGILKIKQNPNLKENFSKYKMHISGLPMYEM